MDAQIADSACTATAYLCGVKNNYGTIGVTGAVPRYDCEASTDPATHLDSIAVWALAKNKSAGRYFAIRNIVNSELRLKYITNILRYPKKIGLRFAESSYSCIFATTSPLNCSENNTE